MQNLWQYLILDLSIETLKMGVFRDVTKLIYYISGHWYDINGDWYAYFWFIKRLFQFSKVVRRGRFSKKSGLGCCIMNFAVENPHRWYEAKTFIKSSKPFLSSHNRRRFSTAKYYNTATQTTFLNKPTTTNYFRKLEKSFDKSKISISTTTDIISVAIDVIY